MNCRVQYSLFKDKYSEYGILIYTADYARNYVNQVLDKIDNNIEAGQNSGQGSDNEQKGKFLIYRNYHWTVDPVTNAVNKEISISVFEEINE